MKPLFGQVKLFSMHMGHLQGKKKTRAAKRTKTEHIWADNHIQPKTILWLWIELTSSFPTLRDSAWASPHSFSLLLQTSNVSTLFSVALPSKKGSPLFKYLQPNTRKTRMFSFSHSAKYTQAVCYFASPSS